MVFYFDLRLLFYIRNLYIVGRKDFKINDIVIGADFPLRNLKFYTDEFVEQVGSNVRDNYWSKFDFGQKQILFTNPTGKLVTNKTFNKIQGVTSHYLDYMDGFISMLWYVKDNSVSLHGLTWYAPDIEHKLNERTCYNPYYTARGQSKDEYFSLEELEEAKVIYEKFQEVCPHYKAVYPKDEDIVDVEYKGGLTQGFLHNHNDLERIERAVMMLDTARTQYHLPSRIAFYVPMFEALFVAKSEGEIAHQVSEKVAFYLESEPNAIKNIYDTIKDAYTIRSKFFHGDTMPRSFRTKEALAGLSVQIDNIARKLMRKVILEDAHKFPTSQSAIEPFLKNIIFKIPSEVDGEEKAT